jgi:hypothetical protein
MKRKLSKLILPNESVYTGTRSKKPKLLKPMSHQFKRKSKRWVSATETRNYVCKDGLVDWLKKYGKRGRKFSDSTFKNTFKDYIFKKGNEFETSVVNLLKRDHEVVSISEFYNKEKIRETERCMREGIPIIHSAPISNKKNNTYGIIDLLIRSDYINRIFEVDPLNIEEVNKNAPKLDLPFHYVVIDIKYSTIPLCSNGKSIRNSGWFPAYKSQTLIYNNAIGNMQGYTPPQTFILGRGWSLTRKGVNYKGRSCLERLGEINYTNWDETYKSKTNSAIKWIRSVHENGAKWSISPPSRDELYPNMCRDSDSWNHSKEKIAKDLGEISLLWQCGTKHRQIGFENGIRTIYDPNCSSEKIGVSAKLAPVVDKMIEINRDDIGDIIPAKIQNNLHNWKNYHPNEMFVDFETFSDIFDSFENLPYQNNVNLIYAIGVGWKENGEWAYKNFVCDNLTDEDEFKIINLFTDFVIEKGSPPLYFWCAENKFWKIASDKHFDRDISEENKNTIIENWDIDSNWKDMCKIFKQEPIIIRDVYGFGLKDIAKKMKSYGMINTNMESECNSGMMAMVKAWHCYSKTKSPKDSPIMKDILKYNEYDCRVLSDILDYLREKHT